MAATCQRASSAFWSLSPQYPAPEVPPAVAYSQQLLLSSTSTKPRNPTGSWSLHGQRQSRLGRNLQLSACQHIAVKAAKGFSPDLSVSNLWNAITDSISLQHTSDRQHSGTGCGCHSKQTSRRRTAVHLKIHCGFEPKDIPEGYPARLQRAMAACGYRVASSHVRAGCIEVLLDLGQHAAPLPIIGRHSPAAVPSQPQHPVQTQAPGTERRSPIDMLSAWIEPPSRQLAGVLGAKAMAALRLPAPPAGMDEGVDVHLEGRRLTLWYRGESQGWELSPVEEPVEACQSPARPPAVLTRVVHSDSSGCGSNNGAASPCARRGPALRLQLPAEEVDASAPLGVSDFLMWNADGFVEAMDLVLQAVPPAPAQAASAASTGAEHASTSDTHTAPANACGAEVVLMLPPGLPPGLLKLVARTPDGRLAPPVLLLVVEEQEVAQELERALALIVQLNDDGLFDSELDELIDDLGTFMTEVRDRAERTRSGQGQQPFGSSADGHQRPSGSALPPGSAGGELSGTMWVGDGSASGGIDDEIFGGVNTEGLGAQLLHHACACGWLHTARLLARQLQAIGVALEDVAPGVLLTPQSTTLMHAAQGCGNPHMAAEVGSWVAAAMRRSQGSHQPQPMASLACAALQQAANTLSPATGMEAGRGAATAATAACDAQCADPAPTLLPLGMQQHSGSPAPATAAADQQQQQQQLLQLHGTCVEPLSCAAGADGSGGATSVVRGSHSSPLPLSASSLEASRGALSSESSRAVAKDHRLTITSGSSRGAAAVAGDGARACSHTPGTATGQQQLVHAQLQHAAGKAAAVPTADSLLACRKGALTLLFSSWQRVVHGDRDLGFRHFVVTRTSGRMFVLHLLLLFGYAIAGIKATRDVRVHGADAQQLPEAAQPFGRALMRGAACFNLCIHLLAVALWLRSRAAFMRHAVALNVAMRCGWTLGKASLLLGRMAPPAAATGFYRGYMDLLMMPLLPPLCDVAPASTLLLLATADLLVNGPLSLLTRQTHSTLAAWAYATVRMLLVQGSTLVDHAWAWRSYERSLQAARGGGGGGLCTLATAQQALPLPADSCRVAKED